MQRYKIRNLAVGTPMYLDAEDIDHLRKRIMREQPFGTNTYAYDIYKVGKTKDTLIGCLLKNSWQHWTWQPYLLLGSGDMTYYSLDTKSKSVDRNTGKLKRF